MATHERKYNQEDESAGVMAAAAMSCRKLGRPVRRRATGVALRSVKTGKSALRFRGGISQLGAGRRASASRPVESSVRSKP
jgi:hypothetical protein